jgi:hypothetical protein
MPFIGLLDVSGIQRFLFRTPELQQIAAASAQIESYADDSHEEAAKTGLFVRHRDGIEVLFAAGGNVALLSKDCNALRKAFGEISRELLESGNGLEIVGAITEYEVGELAKTYQKAVWNLQKRKWTQPRSIEFQFSGLMLQEEPLKVADREPHIEGFKSPRSFRNVICDGFTADGNEQTDLMAVVSIDGIGMGSKLMDWTKEWAENFTKKELTGLARDEAFKKEYTHWSKAIRTRWTCAWDATMHEVARQFGPAHQLIHTVLHEENERPRYLKLHYDKRDKKWFLPCRHIYQGGDDLSFVCDARIALSLTAYLIRMLEKPDNDPKLPERFRTMTVSAGIVFVDSHFPFARAVKLAGDVNKNAKKRAQESKNESEHKGSAPSALDWWINRQGDLQRPDPLFRGATMKPYVLHSEAAEAGSMSWAELESIALKGLWELFRDSRNKLKDLISAAESDRAAGVLRLLRLRPLEKDGKSKTDPFAFLGAHYKPETGFSPTNDNTPLLDAGELFDIHFPFHPEQEG